MTHIKIEVPSDDETALFCMGKSLVDLSGALSGIKLVIIKEDDYELLTRLRAATETLQQAAPQMMDDLRFEGEELHGKRKEPEVDTTAQRVESLSTPIDGNIEVTPQMVESVTPVMGHGVATCDVNGTPWDERIHSTSKALNADGTWRLRRKPKDMDEVEWAAFVGTVKGELHTQTPVMTDEEVEALKPVEIGEPTREEVDELIEASNKMLEPPVTHQNPVYMYQESRNVYALGRSEEEIAEYETKGYVRHTQEQYDAWEGPTVADEGDDFHTDVGVVSEQTVAGIPSIPVPPPVVVAPPVPEVTEWDFPRLMTFLTERHGKIDVATVNTLLAQDGMSSVQELNAHPDKIGPFVARVKAHLGE